MADTDVVSWRKKIRLPQFADSQTHRRRTEPLYFTASFLAFQRMFEIQQIHADACNSDTEKGQREWCNARHTMSISSCNASQCKLDCSVKEKS